MIKEILLGSAFMIMSPIAILAGEKDIKKHPFLYVGEFDTRKPDKQTIFWVEEGRVVWEYSLPLHNEKGKVQEFDDVTLLPDGNIVYAAMAKVGMISSKTKETVWEFVCPEGTESHSCQPVGKDSVLIALNGIPGKILLFNTKENKLLKEIVVPTEGKNTHGQFRHVRMTKEGTITTGLYHEKKAVELDMEGNIIWSADAINAWSVIKLHNGNYLVSGDSQGYTREYNPKGEVVWEVTQKDVPFKLYNNQTAMRLANGNTIICNWVAGVPDVQEWLSSVQFFEITPRKEVVWQVSSWENPDLGPCTYIQLLDEPGNPERLELQR